jgi:hypothetical protein
VWVQKNNETLLFPPTLYYPGGPGSKNKKSTAAILSQQNNFCAVFCTIATTDRNPAKKSFTKIYKNQMLRDWALVPQNRKKFHTRLICVRGRVHVWGFSYVYVRLLNQKQTCDILAGGSDGRKFAQIFFNGIFDPNHQ